MNEQIQRNPDGTFPKGVSGNPKGRNPKAREAALLAIGQEILSQKGVWSSIVNKAITDALGKAIVNGQAVDDFSSTAAGRNAARIFIRDSFIGRPTEYVSGDLADSPFEQLAAYSADDIAVAIAAIEQGRSGRDDTLDPAGGTGAAGEAGGDNPHSPPSAATANQEQPRETEDHSGGA